MAVKRGKKRKRMCEQKRQQHISLKYELVRCLCIRQIIYYVCNSPVDFQNRRDIKAKDSCKLERAQKSCKKSSLIHFRSTLFSRPYFNIKIDDDKYAHTMLSPPTNNNIDIQKQELRILEPVIFYETQSTPIGDAEWEKARLPRW